MNDDIMRKLHIYFLLFLTLVFAFDATAQTTLYNADFSTVTEFRHTSSSPPAAAPPTQSLSGNNWTISYESTPSTDGTDNVFGSDGTSMSSEDFGGEAFFATATIDLTGVNTFSIDGDASTVGGSVFNGSNEYFQWSYTLGSNTTTATAYTSDGSLNTDPAWQNIPTNGETSLTVRFAFDINGSGDGFDVTQLVVTGSNDTVVEFATTEYQVNEGGAQQLLSVSITNPSATAATTVDVVLLSGDAADVGGFTTETLTFPAGSSAVQTATIPITDDTDVEGNETLEFQLQNISGGTNATIGPENVAELDIIDNEGAANTAPVVTYVSDTSGGSVNVNTSVDVTYSITDDNNNIQNPVLNYSFIPTDTNLAPQSGSLSLTATGTPDQFSVTIPGFNVDGTVEFIASATDESNNTGQSPTNSYTVANATGAQLKIFINEVSQGTSGNGEWVELVVVEDNLDLRGYELGDRDDGNFSTSSMVFKNIAQWASVPAGTIIVVYNGQDVDTTLQPDTDFTDMSVTIASNNTFYFSGGWARYSDSDRDDGPAIRDASDMIIHDYAITHPSATITTPTAGNAKEYTGSDASLNSLDDPSNWTTITADTASPGLGNGDDNSVYINTLRGRVTYIYTGGAWSPAVPENNSTNQDILIIEDGTYTVTDDINALDLTIKSGATLDLGTHVLNIAGSLNENGALLATQATINAAGTFRQFIEGNDFEVDTFILNNGAGLVLNSNLSINSSLRLENGTLNIGDDIVTFMSGIENGLHKTAVLDEVTSGSINGDVRVQQFYPANRAFRFVSSPVDMSGGIFANWQQSGRNPGDVNYIDNQGTQITGGTFANGFDQSGTNNPSAFTYDNVTQNWEAVTATRGNALSAGMPVRLLIRGDRTVDLNVPPNSATPTPTTIVTEGELAIGEFRFASPNAAADASTFTSTTVQLSETAGDFNLIGNPYQAQVRMGQILNDPSTTNIVTNSYVIWDPTSGTTSRPPGSSSSTGQGQYVTYSFATGSNTNTSDVNEFIQPSQAVFVETLSNGPATLQFRESFKTDNPFTTTVYNTNNITSLNIWMYESSELNTTLPARDGVLMMFGNQFSDTYVRGEDVVKFSNPGETLSAVQDGKNLSILAGEIPANGDIINLDLKRVEYQNYTFKIQNDFPSSMQVFLVDNFNNTRTALQNGMSETAVTFDLSDPASISNSRFNVEFVDRTLGIDPISGKLNINAFPNPVSNELVLTGLQGGNELEISVYSTTGQLVKTYTKQQSESRETIKGFDTLNNGLYLLTVKEGAKSQTIQLIKK
jgi:hypothetical protein